MYLKSLIITDKNGDVVRQVDFKLGLNLILGKSQDNKTTNSLGKTTLIRCINFCLGGKLEEFYVDSESKSIENTAVKDFIINSKLQFELLLVKDFNKSSISDIRIIRKIEIDKKNKLTVDSFINKVEYTSIHAFNDQLKHILFADDNDKPTFREIIPKFVRRKDHEVNRILYYLGDRIKEIIYSSIYFLLFGFKNSSSISNRQSLLKDLSTVTKNLNAISSIVKDGIKQRIDLLQTEIDQKTVERDSFKIAENFKADEDELLSIKTQLNSIDHEISNLYFNKQQLSERLATINSNSFNDDLQNIEYIYKEADLLNIHLQKKFEDTVNFHNGMLRKEVEYLVKRIEKLDNKIEYLALPREKIAEKYNSTLSKLGLQGALSEYQKLNDYIEKKSIELAHEKALDVKIEDLRDEKSKLESEVEQIDKSLIKEIREFQSVNINIFNTYFSKFSEMLYEEKWYLAFSEESYKFSIQALESNAGSGKKQSLVAAFDIAYMAFIQDASIQLPYPRFATQDKIEVIDIKSLITLAELVQNANGQLIVPIIEDKYINFSDETINSNIILTLTSEDRFFGI